MNPNRILIVMPTRGRPWSALEAIASVMKNAARPDTVELLVCCDNDDPHRFDLLYGMDNEFGEGATITQVALPRQRFIAWMNYAAEITDNFKAFEFVAWLGDDVRYLTPGWDNLVREHPELVVYGPDGYHDKATHPFIRTVIPRALGYLLPKELVHLCPDTFIEALAREIGSISYDQRIQMEHLHFVTGKSPEDQTYKDAKEHWESDKATFETFIRQQIPGMAQIVKAAIK